MPKIEPYSGKDVIKVGRGDPDPKIQNARWWLEKDDSALASSLFGVVRYLKENQGWRQHQAALFARLYGNLPIWNYLGVNMTKLNAQYRFPSERPTFNVIQSCIDGLLARMVQSKPKPMFITDGGDYKKRKLAQTLNKFIDGEFYQTKAYELSEQQLRDALILGNGFLKVFETDDERVGLERVLPTELFVDDSDGMYGYPQQMHQLKIADRDVIAECYPSKKGMIKNAQPAYFDSSAESKDSIVSQIMVVESWHLPSSKKAKDGRHVIAVDSGICFDEPWEDTDFPLVNLAYAPRTLGYWAQGLAEQLMGVQNEINRLLMTIQQSLHLCGVPKWLVEDGSKVVSAHINNMIGGIIKYSGVKPELEVFNVLPPELYQQLERLIQFAFQQSGISMLAAASQKPAGLNSGASLREYDDLQSDRFSFLSQRRESVILELGQKMYRQAKRIAVRTGKYETIYPGKGSIFKVEFPKEELNDDDFIMQNYPVSSLSKNPAERKQEVIEDMQAGLIDPNEGRRLLDYPDLAQENELLRAPEERILKILDEIVEEGKYTTPDPFMDLGLAKKLVVQYYNKYVVMNLEESKADLLRDFSKQLDLLIQSAMPPSPMGVPGQPQAQPMPPPQSPMIQNVPGVAA